MMDPSHEECDLIKDVPLLKLKENDVPLNFLYPDDEEQIIGKCGEQRVGGVISCPVINTVNVIHPDRSSIALTYSGRNRDGSDIIVSGSNLTCSSDSSHGDISVDLSSFGSESQNFISSNLSIFTDHPQKDHHSSFESVANPESTSVQPACTGTRTLFEPKKNPAKNDISCFFSKSERNEKAWVSGSDSIKVSGISQEEVTGGVDIVIANGELLPWEQLSGKTDEDFINGGEGQLSSDSSTNYLKKTVNVTDHKEIHQKEFKTCCNPSPEMVAVNFGENSGDKSKGPLINIPPAEEIGRGCKSTDDENAIEAIISCEQSSHQNQNVQTGPKVIGSRRMPRKGYVRKKTMQTRSSTIQTAYASHGALDPGNDMGIKSFNCGVCKESFTQKLLLKKHVAEFHEGICNSREDGKQAYNNVAFACPVCKLTYKKKYGFKIHFSCKHPNIKSIPCFVCKYIAKNIHDYLIHTELHPPVELNVSQFAPDQNFKCSQLKCIECHRIFQNNNALRLHVLNHNMLGAISQTFSLQGGSPDCIRVLNDSKCDTSRSGIEFVQNSPDLSYSVDKYLNQTILNYLPQELSSTVWVSLEILSKVTSRLDFLAHSVNTTTSFHGQIEKLFQTLNCVSSLSIGLTDLSSSLGQILATETVVKVETDGQNVSETQSDGNSDSCHQEVGSEILDEDDTIYEVENEMKQLHVPETTVKEECMENNTFHVKEEKHVIPPKVRSIRGCKKIQKSPRLYKTEEPHNYDCSLCGKTYKSYNNLNRHMMVHRDLRPYNCKFCKVTFRRNDHLKRHMVIHTEERQFKCDMCNYATRTAKALHTHSIIHGQARSFPCEKCDYVGSTLNKLSKHEKKHNPCSLCSYVPTDIGDYRMHRRSHLTFSCKECNYSCHSSWQLRRHIKKHNPPSEDRQKFCCELCGYSCVEKRHFAYHMARHENKTPFSCSECDYKCSSRSSFDAHKLMHAGLRPYLCSICGTSFRRISHLNNHMLVHKEEKKHVCLTCDRAFRARHNLKVHEMIHTGEKQFKCHLCSFASRRRKQLSLHIGKHVLLDENDVKHECDDTEGRWGISNLRS